MPTILDMCRHAGSRRARADLLIVLALGVVLAAVLVAAGLPRPKIDDACFKSPAAELLQHGRFAVPSALGLLTRADEVFAFYPPLYPLLVAAWYWAFGFSLRSSLAFSHAVHLLSALALMAVTRRLLQDYVKAVARSADAPLAASGTPAPSREMLRAIVLAVGIIHLANTTYFDRVEETGLLWLWLEILAVNGLQTRPGMLRAVASGLCVGLAALTSPWAGVLGAMLVTLRAAFSVAHHDQSPDRKVWLRAGWRWAVTATAALALAAVWFCTMQALYPGAIAEQLGMGVHQVKKLYCSGSVGDKVREFAETVFYNPSQLPATFMALTFPLAWSGYAWRKRTPLGWALYLSAVLGIAAVALLRPIAHTYLGAAQMLLLPCLAPALWHCCSLPRAALGKWLLAGCVLAACWQPAMLGISAWAMPVDERPDAVCRQLRSVIPPGELVAAMSQHWHVFQGRNPWRDACFSAIIDPREVLACRWLVLPAELCNPDYIGGFELVERRWAHSPWRTYAYSLWRRRGLPETEH